MSETKVVQFPLPLPREVGGHVWLIELPGQPITIADKVVAFNLVNRYNAFAQLEADSKKLREPATCNAGHKSNLPLALWDCPVCTQLLRDKLQKVEGKAQKLISLLLAWLDNQPDGRGGTELKIIEKAHEVEAVLGGKAETPDLEAHERDLERQAGCGDV